MNKNYSPVTTKSGTEIVPLLVFNLQIVKEQLGRCTTSLLQTGTIKKITAIHFKNKTFIICKTGHCILSSKFLLQLPPFTPYASPQKWILKATMYSVYSDVSSMVVLKPDHPTCKPTMFPRGMGRVTYFLVR